MGIAERKQLENAHSSANKVCLSRQRSPTCPFVIGDRSAAEWRNLADNWVDLSVLDQIPPLRDAPPHSGRQ